MITSNEKKSTKQKETLTILFAIVTMFISIIAMIVSNSSFLVVAMALTFVSMMFFCLSNLVKHIVLAIMYICIFTFLSSSVIVRFFTGKSDFMYGFTTTEFNTACTLIIISYYMIFWGYVSAKKYRFVVGTRNTDLFSDKYFSINKIQQLAFMIFVGSSIMELFFSIPKMLYAITNGYVSLYTDYAGSYWLTRFSFMASAAFFIGLAAKPNAKRLIWYAILGLINPVITFVQGERSSLVTYVMFLVYYYFIYDNLINETNEANDKKTVKFIVLAGMSMAIVLPFLYNYGFSRVGMSSLADKGNGIVNFFDSQGFSFRLVGASVKYEGILPQKWYSFGSIIDRFSSEVYYVQDELRATMSHSFADAITYLEEKWSYLTGYGMGSSYIAEIFYDFGVIGVVIVNFILGGLLKGLTDFKNLSVFKRSLLFIILQNLMIMPRGAFLRPFDVLISSSTIIVFVIVFGIARYTKGISKVTV